MITPTMDNSFPVDILKLSDRDIAVITVTQMHEVKGLLTDIKGDVKLIKDDNNKRDERIRTLEDDKKNRELAELKRYKIIGLLVSVAGVVGGVMGAILAVLINKFIH